MSKHLIKTLNQTISVLLNIIKKDKFKKNTFDEDNVFKRIIILIKQTNKYKE